MMQTNKSLLDLTAADLMSRDLVTIPSNLSLRAAARLLRHAHVSGVPVVNEAGQCVGILSAIDILRWSEEGGARSARLRTCPHQTNGRLLNGQEVVICTLAGGSCSLQSMQATTGGRKAAVCLMPHDVLCDWQQAVEDAPADEAARYMTTDVVTVEPHTLATHLARMMIDAHIHRVVVTDALNRPIGIVSATDVLAAVAHEEDRLAVPACCERSGDPA